MKGFQKKNEYTGVLAQDSMNKKKKNLFNYNINPK